MHQSYITLLFITFLFLSGCGGTTTSNKKASANSGNIQQNRTPKPHITLNGESTVILHRGDTFTDPGAVAFDNQDGEITSSVTKTITPSVIDTTKPGRYEILYSVTDSDGNKATKKRIIVVLDIVKNPDNLKPATLVINEVLAINSHTAIDPDFKAFSDWIELYNHSNQTVNLGSYYLSDDINNTQKWRLPARSLVPGQHLLIWADKRDQGLHTNFSLDGDGETVLLSDSSGTVIDSLTFDKQKRDISVTNIDDKNYYMIPTPGQKNGLASNALAKSKKPDFDIESGFYTDSVTLKLSQENNGTVYYTLDGSIPFPGKSGTQKYTHPLSFTKTTVVRAAALEKEKFLSSPVTRTYLINENISLPVMSVTIDEDYLYNPEYGIYTTGNHTNYNQDWIRPGSVEYIKNGKPIFSKNVGIKIHGNNTRKYPHKSLALYTKSQFGAKLIDYPLFEQKPYIKKVKSFVLRSGGTNWGRSLIGDGIQHTIVRNMMDIDYHAYAPAVMFLNGKYWGINSIREKMNANYLASNHGIDPKNVDLLANDAEIKNGTNTDYLALNAFVRTNDLSQDANYQHVVSKIDLKEYMNYIVTESFTGNSSIHHNIKYWKSDNPSGKWRWMLFDLDRGFVSAFDDPLQYVADNDETSIIFRNLLRNQTFVHAFASRYFTHLNTTFRVDRIENIIAREKAKVQPEVARHFHRWPKDKDGNSVSVNTWEEFMNSMKNFAQRRGDIVRAALRNDLNLTGTATLTINKPQYGSVKIDDVPLQNDFTGTYFNGATVTLEAVPDNNSTFTGWTDGITQKKRTLTLNGTVNIAPLFTAVP